MNFLNFLTAGASLFNFNLQNEASGSMVKRQNNDALNCALKSDTELKIITKQQELINQYMHLNIQLLSKKMQLVEKNFEKPEIQQCQVKEENIKKSKKINKCQHRDKQHYAKGLCSNCYHRFGRTKKPWKCPHQKLYAGGMCQNCYINNYNRKRREIRSVKQEFSQVEMDNEDLLKIQQEDQN